MPQNIAIVGTGYVGLVSAVCFAEKGNTVWCMDIDEAKLALLREGKSPIYEPGLEPLLQRNVRDGRLLFTSDRRQIVRHAQVVFLCLPTPPNAEGAADVRYVLEAAEELARTIAEQQITELRVLVTRSTVPVGTAEKVLQLVRQVAPSADIRVASNPEFMSEGAAVQYSLAPDRVVIGSSDPEVIALLSELYRPFVSEERPLVVMDERSAEVTKYAANAFLAVRVSFINEISALCDAVGADVEQVRHAIGFDRRIGRYYLHPGIGFGGSCLPKDVRALTHTARTAGVPLRLVEAAELVNREQLERFIAKIRARFGGVLSGRRFALWGLAFKPNTDDVRESPAHKLIDRLLADGARICAYDPQAIANTRRIYGDAIEYGSSQYEVLEGADALIIATEWDEFRTADIAQVKAHLRQPIIFDGRNLWQPAELSARGIEYYPVGRGSVPTGFSFGITRWL